MRAGELPCSHRLTELRFFSRCLSMVGSPGYEDASRTSRLNVLFKLAVALSTAAFVSTLLEDAVQEGFPSDCHSRYAWLFKLRGGIVEHTYVRESCVGILITSI